MVIIPVCLTGDRGPIPLRIAKGIKMIYNEKLPLSPLTSDSLFYEERRLIRELNLSNFIPDSNKSFEENLISFQKRKEKLLAVEKIYEIKRELYRNTGELI